MTSTNKSELELEPKLAYLSFVVTIVLFYFLMNSLKNLKTFLLDATNNGASDYH